MSKVGETIVRGMREAAAYARGERKGYRVHYVRLSKPLDLGRLRKRLKLSQTEFAREFGFSVGTVRDWEQLRRRPAGSARVLLTVIDREPEAVRRALAKASRRTARRAG